MNLSSNTEPSAKRLNRRRGESVYPVEEGYVLKLVEKEHRVNQKLGCDIDHTVFLWILKIYKRKKVQPKLRKVRVFRFFRPVVNGNDIKDAWFAVDSQIQIEYVTRMLKDGYAIISADCPYVRRLESTAKFYQIIDQFDSAK